MRKARWGGFGLAAALATLMVGSCGSSRTRFDLENGDSGRTVLARAGDEIDVTLQTIGPGRYGSPSVSSSAVLFLGSSQAGEPNPGGPRQLYRFEAAAAGRAEIVIPHEGGAPTGPAVEPFTLVVTVP